MGDLPATLRPAERRPLQRDGALRRIPGRHRAHSRYLYHLRRVDGLRDERRVPLLGYGKHQRANVDS
ncbi:hypothetical protein D3C81_1690590 [compost metagenome]